MLAAAEGRTTDLFNNPVYNGGKQSLDHTYAELDGKARDGLLTNDMYTASDKLRGDSVHQNAVYATSDGKRRDDSVHQNAVYAASDGKIRGDSVLQNALYASNQKMRLNAMMENTVYVSGEGDGEFDSAKLFKVPRGDGFDNALYASGEGQFDDAKLFQARRGNGFENALYAVPMEDSVNDYHLAKGTASANGGGERILGNAVYVVPVDDASSEYDVVGGISAELESAVYVVPVDDASSEYDVVGGLSTESEGAGYYASEVVNSANYVQPSDEQKMKYDNAKQSPYYSTPDEGAVVEPSYDVAQARTHSKPLEPEKYTRQGAEALHKGTRSGMLNPVYKPPSASALPEYDTAVNRKSRGNTAAQYDVAEGSGVARGKHRSTTRKSTGSTLYDEAMGSGVAQGNHRGTARKGSGYAMYAEAEGSGVARGKHRSTARKSTGSTLYDEAMGSGVAQGKHRGTARKGSGYAMYAEARDSGVAHGKHRSTSRHKMPPQSEERLGQDRKPVYDQASHASSTSTKPTYQVAGRQDVAGSTNHDAASGRSVTGSTAPRDVLYNIPMEPVSSKSSQSSSNSNRTFSFGRTDTGETQVRARLRCNLLGSPEHRSPRASRLLSLPSPRLLLRLRLPRLCACYLQPNNLFRGVLHVVSLEVSRQSRVSCEMAIEVHVHISHCGGTCTLFGASE